MYDHQCFPSITPSRENEKRKKCRAGLYNLDKMPVKKVPVHVGFEEMGSPLAAAMVGMRKNAERKEHNCKKSSQNKNPVL